MPNTHKLKIFCVVSRSTKPQKECFRVRRVRAVSAGYDVDVPVGSCSKLSLHLDPWKRTSGGRNSRYRVDCWCCDISWNIVLSYYQRRKTHQNIFGPNAGTAKSPRSSEKNVSFKTTTFSYLEAILPKPPSGAQALMKEPAGVIWIQISILLWYLLSGSCA